MHLVAYVPNTMSAQARIGFGTNLRDQTITALEIEAPRNSGKFHVYVDVLVSERAKDDSAIRIVLPDKNLSENGVDAVENAVRAMVNSGHLKSAAILIQNGQQIFSLNEAVTA